MGTSHWNLSDREFLKQFHNCSLDPKLFTHEAHLRLAWLYIMNFGLETALLKIQYDIKKYVNSFGFSDKYNVTLTEAATRAVYHFIMKSKASSFSEFINEFPALNEDFKSLMQNHYSIDIFHSEKAKNQFIEPDVLPFY